MFKGLPVTRHFTVIANKGSGSHPDGELRRHLHEKLETEGMRVAFVELDPASGQNMDDAISRIVQAAKTNGDIVVAAGGDGTLNSVAAACHAQDVTMGIIPMGTFNYFARDNAIPTTIPEAIDLLMTGAPQDTRIGTVNGQAFLVNASLGLYSDVIRHRESDKAVFGRHRLVAAISAAISLFRVNRVFQVAIDTPEGRINRQSMMVFVCNNHLQMQRLGLVGGDDNPPGTLDLVVLKPTRFWQRLRLLVLSLIGKLRLEKRLDEFTAPAFIVDKKGRRVEVVVDGEIIQLQTPLHFRALSQGLRVIRPQAVVTP